MNKNGTVLWRIFWRSAMPYMVEIEEMSNGQRNSTGQLSPENEERSPDI
jgi:hypothetical protein